MEISFRKLRANQLSEKLKNALNRCRRNIICVIEQASGLNLTRRKYHKTQTEPSYQENHSLEPSAMTVNGTESLANSFNETRSVFYCSKLPQLIWDLNHTTSLKILVAVMSIACPVTILLNLLVVIAVKTRRELKKNSNILLSSLAATDLFVGAVSMPLAITFDALVLRRNLNEDVICTMAIVGLFFLYTVCFTSFLHLLLIACERYVAVVKYMKYKVIVTRDRLKKYVTIAWLLPILMSVPRMIMETFGVRYELILVVDVLTSTFMVVCFLFILYFYVKVCLGVRRQNRTQIRSVNALIKAKLEAKIAYTTFWITLSVCISGVPTILFNLFRGILPFLNEASYFRWADTMLLLNSLANPLLYYYRNPQLRKAALELLRCRKPQRIPQQEVRTARRIMQRRYSVASLDVEELQIREERPRLVRSESDTVRRRSNDTVKERPMSVPSKLANDKIFTQQQHNKLVVTVQIENAPRRNHMQRYELSNNTRELKRSQHHIAWKIPRSMSLNENSFVSRTKQDSSEKNLRRSKSVPML